MLFGILTIYNEVAPAGGQVQTGTMAENSGMSMIDRVANIVLFGAIGFAIVAVIATLIYVYYIKMGLRKKKTGEEEDDYADYKILDMSDYVPVEDISSDMTVTENGRLFTAAINTQGFDYFLESPSRQNSVADAYRSFFLALEEPISIYVESNTCDMTPQIRQHLEAVERGDAELRELCEQFTQSQLRYDAAQSSGDTRAAEEEEELLRYLNDRVNVVRWQQEHLYDLISTMESFSEGEATVRNVRYLYSWRYNPEDFPSDTTYADRVKFAAGALREKTTRLCSALQLCGVRAGREDSHGLAAMVWRHFNPSAVGGYENIRGVFEEDEGIVTDVMAAVPNFRNTIEPEVEDGDTREGGEA